ncbi:MAG: adenylate/guanylate cyclase domain-containing protein [Spirochaetes bacterium]|nr:adenylate/guanylate cyclase domain-containing protein [Spirochaetota bacterium]
MNKKIKNKTTIKLSLIIMDVFVFAAFFFAVGALFEFVIKNILLNYNIEKFYENLRTVQFDISNSMDYLENKEEMSYEEYVIDILNYAKLSALKRSKYDNSVFIIISDENENIRIAGKKNNPEIRNIPGQALYKDIINKFEKIKNTNPRKNTNRHIEFSFESKKYIGAAEFMSTGIRSQLKRENSEKIFPLIVLADRQDEFFFIINRIRNIFFIIIAIIFIFTAMIKFYNTMVITGEIYKIRNRMMKINESIQQNGVVSSSLDPLKTKFIESDNLDSSFVELVKSLNKLGDIISGIADRDLYIATLKNDNTLLSPHHENMTIMFLDIQGFTTITEKHKENIISIINQIWTEVENVISKNGGKINKLMGDAALIIFRDLKINGEHNSSRNALYSSIELLMKVPYICKKLDIDFNFRVGLDYGDLTYGRTGTENNYELGVIGDVVNTASRLEALCKQYHTNLLITENIFSNIGYDYAKEINITDMVKVDDDISIKFFIIDKARPKGKKEAKELYTVLIKKGMDNNFIGSDKVFKNNFFDDYNRLLNIFHDSIKYWQAYESVKKEAGNMETENSVLLKMDAQKQWGDIALKFAKFYHESHFPPAEHFIKTLLKFEEFEEFRKRPEMWFNKGGYNVKQPSEEWVRLGFIELDK